MKRLLRNAIGLAILCIPFSASAHEAYVLTKAQFQTGMSSMGFDAIDVLSNPHDLGVFLQIAGVVLIALVFNFLVRHSPTGIRIHKWLGQWEMFGPIIVRVIVAISFFYSAYTWAFLGPEISLHDFPMSDVLRVALFAVSGLIFFGLFTEIAALVALVIFGIAAIQEQWYLLTYLNYFGEIVVLILFGSRTFSLDRLWVGPLNRFQVFKNYETAIVRVCYGFALAYAAVNVKLLHPQLTVMVVNEYHLTQFHWLFPSDPLLVTLGAALSELAIGIFIMIGFEIRMTVLISLFYITLSLLYFREAVWPHLLLYGISLNLIFSKEEWTLDEYVDERTIQHMKKHATKIGAH